MTAARATLQAKLGAASTQLPSLRAVMSAYRAYVRVYFGNSPEELGDFGLSPVAATQPGSGWGGD